MTREKKTMCVREANLKFKVGQAFVIVTIHHFIQNKERFKIPQKIKITLFFANRWRHRFSIYAKHIPASIWHNQNSQVKNDQNFKFPFITGCLRIFLSLFLCRPSPPHILYVSAVVCVRSITLNIRMLGHLKIKFIHFECVLSFVWSSERLLAPTKSWPNYFVV